MFEFDFSKIEIQRTNVVNPLYNLVRKRERESLQD